MAPFDRLLQRINAVGCAGFVFVVLMHVLSWAAGAGAPFTLGNVLGTSRSLIVRASSQNGGEALSIDPVNGGLMVSDWAAHRPENRLTLHPTDATVWPSNEDARLAAAHARYEAWFREYQRHISSSNIDSVEASAKGATAAFGPATQYAYASNCSAPLSEVAELTQHR